MENEIRHFCIRHFIIVSQQATGDCLVADLGQIQSLSIVGKLDNDFIAFLPDLHQQFANFILSCSLSYFTCFNTVRNRIAQQMFKRTYHPFQNATVDFHCTTTDIEVHTLVDFF